MKKMDNHKRERAAQIMKKACYNKGGKVPEPKPQTDGEPDMDPVGKKTGGAVGKKAKHRADKKGRK